MPSKNTKNKLRIGYLLDDTLDRPDGVQQYVLAVGEYMRSIGHETHYIVADTTRKDLQNVHSMGKFLSLKFNGNSVRTPLPASKQKIKLLMDRLDLDVLHVQLGFSPIFGARVINAVGPKCKIIGTWHTFPSGYIHDLSNKILSIFIAPQLKKFASMVSVSQATADFVRASYGYTSSVVPNAVPIKKYDIVAKKDLTKFRIVFLGRFVQRKGPIYLIEALGRLVKNDLLPGNVELIMAGKGPDLEKCKIRASQLDLGPVVSFPGFVDEADKPKLLASADITVFPSTGGEAFGISIVEAMASGQSIVLGGNNSGYTSILGKRPELLFNPRDTSLLAQIILRYINMPKSGSNDLKSWLKKESQKYKTELICEKLLKLYK